VNIELKKWSFEDKEILITICNGVDRTFLSNRLPFPYTDEAADWWLDMVKKHDGADSIFRLIIADGNPVGSISIEPKNDVYFRDAEIGYMLITDAWSKGIASEAVRQICEIAFSKLNIIRITGYVYEPNTASRRVLEKNNFKLEGIMEKAVTKNDKLYNLCIYGKLK
jgi:ribosomal-protein-alanine N-acetyltransferase